MTPEDQQHIAIDMAAIEKPQSPKIFADIVSSFTYASYQNAPVLRGIGVENRSDRQVESLRLELSSTPAFLRPKTWTIDRVVPGDRLPLGDRKVELDAGPVIWPGSTRPSEAKSCFALSPVPRSWMSTVTQFGFLSGTNGVVLPIWRNCCPC